MDMITQVVSLPQALQYLSNAQEFDILIITNEYKAQFGLINVNFLNN